MTTPRRRARARRATPTRGQSLVEFALILPVFLLLFAATLDLGRLFLSQISLTNAAREGAMQASKTPTSFVSGAACDEATNRVICRTLLEAKGSTVTVQPADVQLTCDPVDCSKGLGHTATVTVTGHFQLLTPLLSAFFGGNPNLTFATTSTAQIETLPESSAAPASTPTPEPSPSASPTATPTPVPVCTLPSAGFTATPVTGTSPLIVTFTDTSTSSPSCQITSWRWDFDDHTTYIGQAPPAHQFLSQNKNQPGVYQVSLTVANAAGSNTSAAQTITANP